MSSTADIKQLAAASVGRNVWPFVALDWYARRAAKRTYPRARHVSECVVQLKKNNAPWPWSLKATVAVAAELMGGDVAAIEEACAEIVATRDVDERQIDDEVRADLEAAGLTAAAIKRLGLSTRATAPRATPRPRPVRLTTTVAKRVFVSYSHEGEDPRGRSCPWCQLVRKFSDLLVEQRPRG